MGFFTLPGSFGDVVQILLGAIWLLLPGYISNPTAVAVGGGLPIDMYKTWKNGQRILGDGKSWRGLWGGTAGGIIVGVVQEFILYETGTTYFPSFAPPGWDRALFIFPVSVISFGALFGDAVKSLFKRMAGIARGQKSPLGMDMYDFLIGMLLLSLILFHNWWLSVFTIWHILWLLIFTPLSHRGANIIGYIIGIKQVPW